MIALSDFAVIRGRPAVPVSRAWVSSGLALMTATGLTMFCADASRYAANAAFWVKLGLVMVALALRIRPLPYARPFAALSLTLWSAAVVASRLIADFDK